MKIYGLFLSVLLGAVGTLSAQKFPDKGMPQLYNYTPNDYQQAGKIWAIASASNGLSYFASERGLLEFDGQHWQLFAGSKGFTRSLLVHSDSILYTGSDKDFGVWRRNALLQFEYQSLYPFRESAKGLNEEFWGVYEIDEDVVFVSFYNIYVRKAGQLTKIAAPFRFTKSFFTQGKLYLADEKYGLYYFDGLSLKEVLALPATADLQIVGVREDPQGLLLVSRNQGMFRLESGQLRALNNEVAPFLRQHQVFSFQPIDTTHLAFGTILNGVYITDLEGRIIQHLNKTKGLPNNTILSLHYSPLGTLWLSMDYGLSALQLSDEVAYILDHAGAFGTAETALRQGDDFYLGTNQGLYKAKWSELKNDADGIEFSLLPGSAGQVWTLELIDGQIWCGHDRGLFQVRQGQFIPIYEKMGTLAIAALDAEHLLTGTYNGVYLFARRGQAWEFVHKLDSIQGACSQLEVVPTG
ncbi:MAG: hypothetical protein D6772_07200, partial [Bacteroidetes bacterium]